MCIHNNYYDNYYYQSLLGKQQYCCLYNFHTTTSAVRTTILAIVQISWFAWLVPSTLCHVRGNRYQDCMPRTRSSRCWPDREVRPGRGSLPNAARWDETNILTSQKSYFKKPIQNHTFIFWLNFHWWNWS